MYARKRKSAEMSKFCVEMVDHRKRTATSAIERVLWLNRAMLQTSES
ncbi:hypothetical protein ACFLY6_01035 [Candidatus Dependentiae bacterium]